MPGPLDMPEGMRRKLEELDSQYAMVERRLADPDVMADHRAVRDLAIQKAAIAPLVESYRRLRAVDAEITGLRGTTDTELAEMAREELPRLESEAAALLDSVKSRLVTSDDRRVGSVMLEVRAGTGGDEAGLWAADLLAMYEKFAARRGWSWEALEVTAESGGSGGGGGLRSATVNVRGEGVWSEMAFEAGVHSVKRVPATEAQGRVHTSTATVAVLPEPTGVEVKIDWARDVEEHVTTSQGPGGQNVNKVATAVQLHHKPSGIMIRMQESKSQQQNRERARRLLMARLYEQERRRQHAERTAARRGQIGSGDRSEKIRTYRYKEGIVADERLPGEYQLRDLLAGDMDRLMNDLTEMETARRMAEL
ncbi:MAG: PCRF domain-containing protein [Phycisphaerales bacterium]|nr:PCRF domain-containing protein [Phycisphaerales bacterium]